MPCAMLFRFRLMLDYAGVTALHMPPASFSYIIFTFSPLHMAAASPRCIYFLPPPLLLSIDICLRLLLFDECVA